jgi:hypothetical protein
MKSVYSAVWTGPLNEAVLKVNLKTCLEDRWKTTGKSQVE